MATGALGHLGISKQNSFGTNTASWFFLPFVSESVVHNIEKLISQGILARLQEGESVLGLERAEGAIVMEPHALELGHFLRGAMGQASSSNLTSVAGFQDYSHIFQTRNADFDNSTPLPPYTLQVYRGVDEAFQFTDAVISRLEFAIEAGTLIRCTAGVFARTTSLMTKSTPTYTEITPWSWAVTSVSLGGTAIEFIETMNVAVENSIEGIPVLNRRTFGRFGRTGYQQILVSGRMDLQNLDQYDDFVADTARALKVHLAPSNAGSGPYLTIDIPNMKYNAVPVQVGGPFRLTVDFEAKGYFLASSNTAARFTLVNTRTSY